MGVELARHVWRVVRERSERMKVVMSVRGVGKACVNSREGREKWQVGGVVVRSEESQY